MIELGSTMRILRPAPNVIAFYDGRIPGVRAHSDAPNWLDDGAFTLGIASYAIVDGDEGLVYDTHISLAHAAIVRRTLERAGVTKITVVLSHWHNDHVAGNAVFQDCEIVANRLTAAALAENRENAAAAIPPIDPLILPTRTFGDSLTLQIGGIPVELHQFDIHSHDGTVLFLRDRGLLFAGDTLEDPVTYVAEPDRLAWHLQDLERLAGWPIERILPSHGAPDILESGGYRPDFIEATRRYVEALKACRGRPDPAHQDLREFVPDLFTGDAIRYEPAYEPVHRANLAAVSALPAKA